MVFEFDNVGNGTARRYEGEREEKAMTDSKEGSFSGSDRAKAFLARLNIRYQQAYALAMETGKDRLDDLRRTGAGIEPKMKQLIGDGLHTAGRTFDQLNQSLARKAVPLSRRKNVLGDDASTTDKPKG